MNNQMWVLNSIMESINPTPKIVKIKQEVNYKSLSDDEISYIKENLGKFPFRGGISVIAKERKVTRAAIYKSIVKHNNLYYLSLIKKMADDKLSMVS